MANSKLSRLNALDAVFLLCLLAGVCFLVWRAPFGFASSDEAFYLTVPYRLTMGDALLAEEWHVSQMAGFLLLPIMKVYLLFTSDTEGILLAFRYICVAAQTLATIYIYIRLRRTSPVGSLFAALVFLLYVPFNISALSYNSMGIILMSCACVTAATISTRPRRDLIFSGLFFAGAVLCCPHLVLLYAIYCVAVMITLLWCKLAKRKANVESLFSLRSWFFFSVGAAALALVFFVFLLARSDLRTLVNSAIVIFNDPEHPSTPFLTNVYNFSHIIVFIHNLAFPALCGCAVLFAVILFDKESRGKRRNLYIFIAGLLCAVYFAPFLFDGIAPLQYTPESSLPRYVNFIMFPLNILGLFAYRLCSRRDTRLLLAVYIPGLIYGLCVHLSSNQRFHNIASVATVSLLASVVFIFKLISELKAQERPGKLPIIFLSCFVALQLVAQVSFRCSFVFIEHDAPAQLTHAVAYGPAKGLRTTDDTAQTLYYDLYEATEPIREKAGGNVLYFSKRTWLYLADSKSSAAYSAWLSFVDMDKSMNKLLYYWLVTPDKQPQYIFIDKGFPDAAQYVEKLNLWSLSVTETPCGYILGA